MAEIKKIKKGKTMKFEIKHNIFATGVKKVNLSEQEADYIVALASGVEKDKILKTIEKTGDSINGYIIKAIENQLKTDGIAAAEQEETEKTRF